MRVEGDLKCRYSLQFYTDLIEASLPLPACLCPARRIVLKHQRKREPAENDLRPDLEMSERVRLGVRGEEVATKGGMLRIHRVVAEEKGRGRRRGGGARGREMVGMFLV